MDETIPAIGISFRQTIDESAREIVLQCHIPADCTDEALIALLDKLSSAADRQKAKTHLPTEKNLLDEAREALDKERSNYLLLQAEYDIVNSQWQKEAESNGRRKPLMSPQYKQKFEQLTGKLNHSEQSIKVLEKRISSSENIVATMERKVSYANDHGVA